MLCAASAKGMARFCRAANLVKSYEILPFEENGGPTPRFPEELFFHG